MAKSLALTKASLLLQAMRPKQWTKNLLLLAGLYFSSHMLDPLSIVRAVAGFAIFCLLSGMVYLINDSLDAPQDRLHPTKRNRPIASGQLAIHTAIITAASVGVVSLGGAFALSPYFGMCALAYAIMMLAYCLKLKEVFLIDTLIIAMGFIIRAVAGVIVLRTATQAVPLTTWFVVCVMFLSLLLAFCKRRSERANLGKMGRRFRPVLAYYTVEMLDIVIGVCAAGALLSYTIYTTSSPNPWLMLSTVPFVLFGIFRYLHLVYSQHQGEAPEDILRHDWAMIGCVALWAFSLLFIYLPINK